MKPVPARQRRQAHRQRKAFGRALHQMQRIRGQLSLHWGFNRTPVRYPLRIVIPRMVRHRSEELRRVLTA